MGLYNGSKEQDLHDQVLGLPRSQSFESHLLITLYLPSSTRARTSPKSLMNFWAVPLHSTLPRNTRNTSPRTVHLQPTPNPRNSCKSPSANCLRCPIILNYAHFRSSGFTGAFLDREIETKGVRSEYLVVTTLPIHSAHAYSSASSTERRLSMKVCPSLSLIALTICADKFYSQEEDRVGLRCNPQRPLNIK